MNRLFIGLLTAIIVLLPCREISAKQKKEVKEVPDREVWCFVGLTLISKLFALN